MKSCLIQIKNNLFSFITLGVVILSLIMFYDRLNMYPAGEIGYTTFISYSFIYNTFMVYSPIAVSLIASTNFCDHFNSGIIRSILIRQSKKKYLLEQYIVSTLTGGMLFSFIVAIVMIVILIIGVPFYKPTEPLFYVGDEAVFAQGAFDLTAFNDIQYIWGGAFVSLVVVLLAFVFGAIWANIGLIFSVFIPNKDITIAFPLLLYTLMNNVLHSTGLAKYSPVNTIVPAMTSIESTSFIIIEQLVVFAIITIIYIIAMNRRLKNV